jgi:hypothetical protein
MDKKKCLQLLVSLVLPCIGLALDLFHPDVLGALCLGRNLNPGIANEPSLNSTERIK